MNAIKWEVKLVDEAHSNTYAYGTGDTLTAALAALATSIAWQEKLTAERAERFASLSALVAGVRS